MPKGVQRVESCFIRLITHREVLDIVLDFDLDELFGWRLLERCQSALQALLLHYLHLSSFVRELPEEDPRHLRWLRIRSWLVEHRELPLLQAVALDLSTLSENNGLRIWAEAGSIHMILPHFDDLLDESSRPCFSELAERVGVMKFDSFPPASSPKLWAACRRLLPEPFEDTIEAWLRRLTRLDRLPEMDQLQTEIVQQSIWREDLSLTTMRQLCATLPQRVADELCKERHYNANGLFKLTGELLRSLQEAEPGLKEIIMAQLMSTFLPWIVENSLLIAELTSQESAASFLAGRLLSEQTDYGNVDKRYREQGRHILDFMDQATPEFTVAFLDTYLARGGRNVAYLIDPKIISEHRNTLAPVVQSHLKQGHGGFRLLEDARRYFYINDEETFQSFFDNADGERLNEEQIRDWFAPRHGYRAGNFLTPNLLSLCRVGYEPSEDDFTDEVVEAVLTARIEDRSSQGPVVWRNKTWRQAILASQTNYPRLVDWYLNCISVWYNATETVAAFEENLAAQFDANASLRESLVEAALKGPKHPQWILIREILVQDDRLERWCTAEQRTAILKQVLGNLERSLLFTPKFCRCLDAHDEMVESFFSGLRGEEPPMPAKVFRWLLDSRKDRDRLAGYLVSHFKPDWADTFLDWVEEFDLSGHRGIERKLELCQDCYETYAIRATQLLVALRASKT